ncbi:unnamed protein product [Brassica rapa]|uniref:Uncharacterized protein n=1 Tax=Brassica campestris TaxID=3711 RepID=A0A8D9G7P8_BRACM|nr:unnamed protein product [Brassica rapa]
MPILEHNLGDYISCLFLFFSVLFMDKNSDESFTDL